MMIVDMHCHILPGVDDGPESMEDTIAVLKEAQRQGIDTMIVTPHFHPGRYVVKASVVLETLGKVRRQAAAEGIAIRLLPGQECYYYSGLINELDAGNVLTMNRTKYVLIEFDNETQYSTITFAVRELRSNGYKPIIAHFERYRCLYNHIERLEELRKRGATLQLNFDRLLDKGNFFHPNGWRKLLKDGYVDFLGSDTHGMGFRPLHVDKAVEWLEKYDDLYDRIMDENIKKLIPMPTLSAHSYFE